MACFGQPIVHVLHDSLDPESVLRLDAPGGEPLPGFEPLTGEHRIVKHENGAFAGTGLSTLLRRLGVDELLIAGMTVQHCVSTTVCMAANSGFKVSVAGDACVAFASVNADGRSWDAETVHAVHLAGLHREFCNVCSTASVLST